MKQFIIGLWGPVGVGKDSVADALGFPKAGFASTLKADLGPIFQRLDIDIADRAQKEKVRELMICLGKTARAIDPNHWIKRLSIPDAPIVTVSDVRYFNEILAVLFRGGRVYEIAREGFEPANDEEKRSFGEIRRRLDELGVSIPTVFNSTPEQAAEEIADDLTDLAHTIQEYKWAGTRALR